MHVTASSGNGLNGRSNGDTSMTAWHGLDVAESLGRLGTDGERGLSAAEAVRRLDEYGANELKEHGLKSPWRILWEQLTASMVVILIIAAVVSLFLGDEKDAIAILVIVVLNAVLGFQQEYKAERAMAALKALAVPTVRVMRDGNVREVSARELVPGDVVLLEMGNVIPADGRLIESVNLRIQESALTGESEPVEKGVEPLAGKDDLALADRKNMVYMGTVATYGRGTAVITSTGMETELGRIASMIQTVGLEATPLQRRLAQLGRGLAMAALALVGIVFTLGLMRGEGLEQMILISLSMAVAAVPEGLPAVVTIALALGSQRMLRRRALIRKLPAVEALGSVTVICSDKTGTLTINRMTATIIDVAGHELDLDTHLNHDDPLPDPAREPLSMLLQQPPAVGLLAMGGALCNDARLEPRSEEGELERYHTLGDPTEGALVMTAARMGFWKSRLDAALPRVAEEPFESDRKRMTTVHVVDGKETARSKAYRSFLDPLPGFPDEATHVAFTKGAVDAVTSVSDRVMVDGRVEPLTEEWARRIQAGNDRLASKGMRVLGVACRPLRTDEVDAHVRDKENLERHLIYLGMVGMIDPARSEVKDAVATCRTAGIRPVMITGDHPLTARYIAVNLGIARNDRILTGKDLDRLSVEDLEGMVEDVAIYARVSPEHKLNIVQALQDRGHIVAMTGDGVNDAPALKKADIGVAMGVTGTDVAKEVADMVLLDDNFATIVSAVEEGRVIYDNIRKFIKYILTSNSGEILVMLVAPFLGLPLPLLPLQILWINLLTDGLPGLALGVEPAEYDTMRRPPYRPDENIFGRGLGRHILWVGCVLGAVPLLVGYWYRSQGLENWRTMLFTVLTLSQLGHALAIRSNRFSLFTIGVMSNKPFLGAFVLTFVLQMMVIYVPFLQSVLHTVPLSLEDNAAELRNEASVECLTS